MLKKYSIYIKYLITGATVATTDLLILFLFTDIFGLWYLFSATIAFIIAFFVSFFLQKYWTFQERSHDRALKQLIFCVVLFMINVAINASGMYVLVDIMKLNYLLAQFFTLGSIAAGNFFVYRYLIFKSVS